jgi:hypothetical protein
VNSLELDSVIVQARLGSARLLYKLGSTRLGYCISSARTRLSSTRLGSFTGLSTYFVVLEERDVGVVDLRKQAMGQRPGAGGRVVQPAAGGRWALLE